MPDNLDRSLSRQNFLCVSKGLQPNLLAENPGMIPASHQMVTASISGSDTFGQLIRREETMRPTWFIAAALTATVGVSAGAEASTLYATTYTGGTSTLYTVNQSTGAATAIGTVQGNIGDLTSIGGGHVLLGVDLTLNALWTIDPVTAVASNLVSILGTQGTITSIAYNPVTGILFGNTTTGFGGADQLYTIDPNTGVATLVGNIGIANLYALGFTQTGTLLGESDATGNLVSVNTTTGAGTVIGPTGLSFNYDLASRPEDDVVFGADSGFSSLYTYNVLTGATTLVGPYGGTPSLAGLAFLVDVPEPASMAVLSAGLFGLGWLRRRR